DYAHDRTRTLDFGAIRRGWLRELLKRWARYRLQSGTMAPQGVSHSLWSFKELERFCELSGIELADAEQLSRGLLEEFLDHVARLPLKRNTKHALLRHVKVVLDDVDRHGWVRLARDARYFRDELPSQRRSLPRFIDEAVMRQLEREAALERLGDETTITAVVVLMETGLRSQDALLLEVDPVVVLADGSPVLRFVNHKRRREAAIPISDRLLERIRYQQQRERPLDVRDPHAASQASEGKPATVIDMVVKRRGLGTIALLLGVHPFVPAVCRDQHAALRARRERPPQLGRQNLVGPGVDRLRSLLDARCPAWQQRPARSRGVPLLFSGALDDRHLLGRRHVVAANRLLNRLLDRGRL
ncbi:MAG: hypothetical protein WBP81_18315, partial [Solirubrobacteraceae bacterium]